MSLATFYENKDLFPSQRCDFANSLIFTDLLKQSRMLIFFLLILYWYIFIYIYTNLQLVYTIYDLQCCISFRCIAK